MRRRIKKPSEKVWIFPPKRSILFGLTGGLSGGTEKASEQGNSIGSAHFHTAKALRAELSAGGFPDSVVHGVMGGAWLAREIDELWKNEASRNALMNTVRLLDTNEEIIGLSCHLLAVSGN